MSRSRAWCPYPHNGNPALGGFMGNKLYIGNLPFSASEQSLSSSFSQCGTVDSVKIITDRDTGRSKGFGFVEMSNSSEAAAVITKFNGVEFEGRQINVSEAKPKEDNRSSGQRARW